MRVLVVEGPSKGLIRVVSADNPSFLQDGVLYRVVYEIFGNHPNRPQYKLVAPFAVSEGSLPDVMEGSYELSDSLKRELDCLKEYRWMPGIRK